MHFIFSWILKCVWCASPKNSHLICLNNGMWMGFRKNTDVCKDHRRAWENAFFVLFVFGFAGISPNHKSILRIYIQCFLEKVKERTFCVFLSSEAERWEDKEERIQRLDLINFPIHLWQLSCRMLFCTQKLKEKTCEVEQDVFCEVWLL